MVLPDAPGMSEIVGMATVWVETEIELEDRVYLLLLNDLLKILLFGIYSYRYLFISVTLVQTVLWALTFHYKVIVYTNHVKSSNFFRSTQRKSTVPRVLQCL